MQCIFEQGEKTGLLLALLAKEQQPVTSIARIKDDHGTVVIDPQVINAHFASYYKSLYSSRALYSDKELWSYLDQIAFPMLTTLARDSLDSPITLKEDSLPSKFYKQYGEQLLPKLHAMRTQALEGGILPDSMAKAIIVVIPKPDKDAELCTSYWPISLLNVDVKILTKVLDGRINYIILILIHE